MKKFLLFFVLYSSSTFATEWLVGVGDIYQADGSGYKMYSFSIEKNTWKANLSQWDTYPKTAWIKDHPEWGVDYVESHYTVGLVGTLFEYETEFNLKFYFDLGLVYASKLSKVNSSHINFQENLGVAYKNLRLYFRHTSNASIVPPNRGEDALVFEIAFYF